VLVGRGCVGLHAIIPRPGPAAGEDLGDLRCAVHGVVMLGSSRVGTWVSERGFHQEIPLEQDPAVGSSLGHSPSPALSASYVINC